MGGGGRQSNLCREKSLVYNSLLLIVLLPSLKVPPAQRSNKRGSYLSEAGLLVNSED